MVKLSADKIFDGFTFLENQVLIIDNDGTIKDLVPITHAGEDVKHIDGIISPGFVNCHCHLELSHMKNHIAPGTGLVKFVTDVVQQRHYPEEQILAAIENADLEMWQNGIAAVGDICNNVLTIPQKKKTRLYYHNFIEASGFDPFMAALRFERAKHLYDSYKQISDAVTIVPHAPYSVSDELWELILQFPNNALLTIHNQEAEGENEWFQQKSGAFNELYRNMNIDVSSFRHTSKTSLQSFLPKFQKGQSLILVHNVHTSQPDIDSCFLPIGNFALYWCLCVNANKYITGNLPDIDLLRKNKLQIVLGTDSLASNNQLSILEEIKIIQKHFPSLSQEELLKWGTSNGAKALNIDNTYGTLEKGKRPGLVKIDNSFQTATRII